MSSRSLRSFSSTYNSSECMGCLGFLKISVFSTAIHLLIWELWPAVDLNFMCQHPWLHTLRPALSITERYTWDLWITSGSLCGSSSTYDNLDCVGSLNLLNYQRNFQFQSFSGLRTLIGCRSGNQIIEYIYVKQNQLYNYRQNIGSF